MLWVMHGSSFGNALYPTDHTLEIAFSILVITCGLLLFTMLIGNIQVSLCMVLMWKQFGFILFPGWQI